MSISASSTPFESLVATVVFFVSDYQDIETNPIERSSFARLADLSVIIYCALQFSGTTGILHLDLNLRTHIS